LRRKGELAAHPPMRHKVGVVDNVDAVAAAAAAAATTIVFVGVYSYCL